MDRITNRLPNGIPYVQSETGNDGVGTLTIQRRIPDMIIKLAKYEDEAERREHGCAYCNTGNLTVTHSIDGQDAAILHEVLYCPVCGRKLEV